MLAFHSYFHVSNKHLIWSKNKETTDERFHGVAREYYTSPPYDWQGESVAVCTPICIWR
jgi:hypothetical protein